MVSKSKQNWQTVGWAHQEEKRSRTDEIRNETGALLPDTAEVQGAGERHAQADAGRADSRGERSHCPETHSPPKLNQETDDVKRLHQGN